MSYLATIAQDLERAKQIVDRGKMTTFEKEALARLSEEEQKAVVHGHGSIYPGSDSHDAYKLLESLVAEVERLQGEVIKKAPAKAEPPKI